MNLIYDTETTGLPIFKEPSEGVNQPHIVDLHARLYNDQGELVEFMDTLVKPDGWIIPDDVIAVHGITNEMANDLGIPESEAIDQFIALHEKAAKRVAHNVSFDDRIIRIALMRFRGEDFANWFKEQPNFCTCNTTTQIVKCPPSEKMIAAGRGKQFKMPNVSEALLYFTGDKLMDAHRAMPDTIACARIYHKMHGILMPEFPQDFDYIPAEK